MIRQNFRLLRRADILVDLLRQQWKISGSLKDLPETPVWWINATCLETGKNWRFSKREMGDWRFGRHYEPPFGLASAVAASAAVPYAIGALRFELPRTGWYATDPATRKPLHSIRPTLDAVHLWDGGAYENLGWNRYSRWGRDSVDCDFLICSDAFGAPFDRAEHGPFHQHTSRSTCKPVCSTSPAIKSGHCGAGCSSTPSGAARSRECFCEWAIPRAILISSLVVPRRRRNTMTLTNPLIFVDLGIGPIRPVFVDAPPGEQLERRDGWSGSWVRAS